MIEVIKYGTKKVVDCCKCGCRFSYEEEDIRVDIPPDEDRYYVICPQCENEISVTLPRDMKR